MFEHISRMRHAVTKRCSSWDKKGGNEDYWMIEPGETRTLADIEGPGRITHIWLTQRGGYRECLLRFTWDDAKHPSIDVPLGDFFCLGHGMVSSFQSALFTASTNQPEQFNTGCALNCYAPMPFRKRAKIELVNQGKQKQWQFFYIDYESVDGIGDDEGYFHAEFRRANPFGGWGPEIKDNTVEANIVNEKRTAWDNNYVILDTRGRGHYIGCNLSVSNFHGTWWGEGDDMIWVDGYKWPPDLHGTGSEDYLNQAWGMQPNAFLRNGSSIWESNTIPGAQGQWFGGYQSSYVFHLENPVHFRKEIKVTIEHGHGNHQANEMSSVAYWYAQAPTRVIAPPPVAQRMPVLRDNQHKWIFDKSNQCPGPAIKLNSEMKRAKKQWAQKSGKK